MPGFDTVQNGEIVSDESPFVGADDVALVDNDLDVRPEEMGLAPEPAPEPAPKAENNDPEPAPANVADPEAPEAGAEAAGVGKGKGGEPAAGEAATEENDPAPVAAEPAAGPEPVAEGVKVPKARLDKVLRDKRALENRIAQLEQAQAQAQPDAPPEPAAQIEKVDPKEIAEALLDGDLDKYAELQQKHDAQVRAEVLQEVATTVPQQVSEQQQRTHFDTVLSGIEAKYDVLDPRGTSFDQGIVDTITGFARTYSERGYTPADALLEATEKVLRVEKPELFRVAPATSPAAVPAKLDPKVEQLKQERLNIDQKLKAAAAQPPEVSGGDIAIEPIPDFGNMSDDDFDRLSEAQLVEFTKQMKQQAMG